LQVAKIHGIILEEMEEQSKGRPAQTTEEIKGKIDRGQTYDLRIQIKGKELELLLNLIDIHYYEKHIPEPTAKAYVWYLFEKDYEETRQRVAERRRRVLG